MVFFILQRGGEGCNTAGREKNIFYFMQENSLDFLLPFVVLRLEGAGESMLPVRLSAQFPDLSPFMLGLSLCCAGHLEFVCCALLDLAAAILGKRAAE